MDEVRTPRTLAIDIGGSGVKLLTLDTSGEAITERLREPTPAEPTPSAVLEVIVRLATQAGEFERVAVGFPGVVIDGEVRTAVNLHPDWIGFDLTKTLAELFDRPVRAANDADIQGLGVVEGRGVELVLTLGTGIGSALFVDGHLVPNLELGHHPFEKKSTYEERLGDAALRDKGAEKWNRRLERAIALLGPIFNYRKLYLGGGNAKRIAFDPPPNVERVANIQGLLGGIKLWEQ